MPLPLGRPINGTGVYVLQEGSRWRLRARSASCTRRRRGRARLPEPAGADGGAVRARSVSGRRARGCTGPATWRAGVPDGTLEFLGRDGPPGQDARLPHRAGGDRGGAAAHRRCEEAVVLAREDRPGEKRLVAYVVGGGARAGRREAAGAPARRALPDYMVPSAFVALECAAADAERQGGPPGAAGAGGGGLPARRVRRAAHASWSAGCARSGRRCWASSGWGSRTTSSSSAGTRCWRRGW